MLEKIPCRRMEGNGGWKGLGKRKGALVCIVIFCLSLCPLEAFGTNQTGVMGRLGLTQGMEGTERIGYGETEKKEEASLGEGGLAGDQGIQGGEGMGWAGKEEETLDSYLAELDFSGINEALRGQESTADLDFRELVEMLLNGEEMDKGKLFLDVLSMVFEEIASFRGRMAQIVFLCIVFAILHNFANVFENPTVTRISFYMVYMLLLALLMNSFFVIRDITTEVISEMMIFLKVLIPTFAISMAFSGQVTTAAGFYEMTFLLIYGMEWLMQYLILPAIQIYVALELMNYLTEEEMVSRMTELLRSAVLWVMKLLFTVVVGINVVQNLLTPVIDTFKSSLITKTAGMLPGLGTSLSAVTEIMVGSGIVIKNGVGLAAVFVLLLLCAGPLVKIGVMSFLYKLLAAVIQPVTDKRMVGCISSAGEGGRLLGKVVVTTTVMFLVTIAMVTAATTFVR